MPQIHFDRYYRYDDLTRLLQAYAAEYPKFIQVESIGKSYEGRDIWVVTVTNSATGPANEKPAFWVDGNIHASEVSPSTACLYLLNKLATGYGKNDDITRALDTRAFYICPRINPDGAEWALADKPKIVRSSTRPYPYDEEPLGGLTEEDVDGDGRMLQMRMLDPNGQWKPHPEDARLLIRRDPTEVGGTYYRVLPEGTIADYDGVRIWVKPDKEGLDLNRNFPANWRQEGEQRGAGPYPASEPEVRAIVEFVARHNNIHSGTSFHTFSGVLLRPFCDRADSEMPAEDLWTYEKVGKKGTELTTYPNISIFHDFKYHPKQIISGGFDWIYEHLGMYMWAVEIWSPQRQAGITEYKYIDWYREHPPEDDLKMMKWNDETLGGKGFVDWYEFDHPQLGKIELGGWDELYAWRNPPPQFLEKEVALFADWLIWQCLISPRLELFDVKATPLGGGAFHVQVAVHNTGWLPTYGSKKALEKRVVRPLIAEIDLPPGATLKTGKQREEIGQLEGRAYVGVSANPWGASAASNTSDRTKVEWVIHAPDGGTINLTARHERAGVVRAEVEL
jgi:murein tripeptide amidase MpaA